MSFLFPSLDSLFRSFITTSSRGESNDDDDDYDMGEELLVGVGDSVEEMDMSFWTTTTHDDDVNDNDGREISSGWQEIVLGVPCFGSHEEEEEESVCSSGTIVSSAPPSTRTTTTYSSSGDIDIFTTAGAQARVFSSSSQSRSRSCTGQDIANHIKNANALQVLSVIMTPTESVYRNWQSLLDNNNNNNSNNSVNTSSSASCESMDLVTDLSHFDNLSFTSVPTLHSRSSSSSSSSSSNDQDQVDGTLFRNIADRLALLSHGGIIMWYSRFTEQDWMELQQVANMVLSALDEQHEPEEDDGHFHMVVPVSTREIIAQDVDMTTECSSSASCPSCQTPIDAAVPCPALLDVATLAHISNEESNRRRRWYHRHCYRRDLLLAEWIQQEEDCLYDDKSRQLTSCKLLSTLLFLAGECAMYVALASLSAVGMSVLSR